MKKLIQWLAKVFNAIIIKEVIVEKEKIIYKDKIVEVPVEIIKEVIKEVEVIKYLPNPDTSDAIKYDGLVEGDLTVEGNLLVTGSLNVSGGVTCLTINGINNSNKNK